MGPSEIPAVPWSILRINGIKSVASPDKLVLSNPFVVRSNA